MENTKVLYVSQEITPYLPESEMSVISRYLPQGIQEKGWEIRTFMPRFGNINERRNQLHEVIRLSGMNLIIDDTDHPLIIKVASIQAARMQVYFIDNEDYFHRKSVFQDKNDKYHEDNDERAIFFCKGVLETVKKLGWAPDIVHCNDWMTSLIPMYIKTTYKNDPIFKTAKTVFTVYDNIFAQKFNNDLVNKVKMMDIEDKMLAHLEESSDLEGFIKVGMEYSDAVIKAEEKFSTSLTSLFEKVENEKKLEITDDDENYTESYFNLYTDLLN